MERRNINKLLPIDSKEVYLDDAIGQTRSPGSCEQKNRKMERWKDGKTKRWKDGKKERRKDGKTERRRDGK